MFQRYKIVPYSVVDRQEWGIHKRLLLFWYKPLVYLKYVLKNNSGQLASGCPSREILTFRTEEDAESEIDRMEFGYQPIYSRTFQNGVLLETKYKRIRRSWF